MASIDCNECERSGGRDNPSSITMPWMNMFIIYRNVFRWMYCRVASFTYLIVCFLLAPAPVESFYERRVNSPFDNAKSGAVFGVFFFFSFFAHDWCWRAQDFSFVCSLLLAFEVEKNGDVGFISP